MGLVDDVMGAMIALFIIFVFFWYVFPELAKVTGIYLWWMNLIRVLMIVAVILK